MSVEQYSLVANDWLNLEFIINDLSQRVIGQELHPTSDPVFNSLTLSGIADTHVVYSKANVLTGDSSLVWDYINKRLGIGITPVDHPLHIYKGSGNVGAFIQSVDGYANLNLGNSQSGTIGYGLYCGFPTAGNFTIRENTVANRLVIAKTTGFTGINSSIPPAPLYVLEENDSPASMRGVQSVLIGATSHSSHVTGRKARGTEASPVVLDVDDGVGAFTSEGYNGSAYERAGYLRWVVTDVSGGNLSTKFTLATSTLGNETDKVIVMPNGDMGIGVTPAKKFEIGSTDNSDLIGIYHDNTDAYIKWTDGFLNLQTDEGTNSATYVRILGKGTNRGFLLVYDQDDAEYIQLSCNSGFADIFSGGASPQAMRFQNAGDANITMFSSATEGLTPVVSISGFRTGDIKRTLEINVGWGAVDTVSFNGLSNYFFGGNIDNAKSRRTDIGGFAVKLTNKTGANTVAGQLVKADTATDDAVILTAAGDNECFGVFLDSGIADGSEAWVVVSGIADVAMEDNTAATHGNWVQTSDSEAGYADATSATPAAAPAHFEEVGHCIESVAAGGGGTHILARCIVHFN